MTITIYTKSNCPNCLAAKQLLKSKGLEYQEINLDDEIKRSEFNLVHPAARQMPQIFIGDQRVGGLAGLQAALARLKGQS